MVFVDGQTPARPKKSAAVQTAAMTPAALSAIVLSFTRESGGAADKLGYNGRPRPPAPSLPRSLSGITGTYFIEAIRGGPGGAVGPEVTGYVKAATLAKRTRPGGAPNLLCQR